MIGVYQPRSAPPWDDGFSACLASLLEVDVHTLPDDRWHDDPWVRADLWNRWLEQHGLGVAWYDATGDWWPSGYWIGTIEVGPHRQSCVYRERTMVWQPDRNLEMERTLAGEHRVLEVVQLVVTDLHRLKRSSLL